VVVAGIKVVPGGQVGLAVVGLIVGLLSSGALQRSPSQQSKLIIPNEPWNIHLFAGTHVL